MDTQITTNTSSPDDNVVGLQVSYFVVGTKQEQMYYNTFFTKRFEDLRKFELSATEYTIEFNRYKKELSWVKNSQADTYQIFLMEQAVVSRKDASNDCKLVGAFAAYIEGYDYPGFKVTYVPKTTTNTTIIVDDTKA